MTAQRLLIVLGEGGHTTEILNLVDQLGDGHEIHYVMTVEDEISADRIRRPGVSHRIRRPRAKDSSNRAAALQLLVASAQSIQLAVRVRPRAVITSGPALGVPLAVAAKAVGSEVIFVETIARVTSLSMTGRLMRRLADLYFVQWPDLVTRVPGAVYAGRLL